MLSQFPRFPKSLFRFFLAAYLYAEGFTSPYKMRDLLFISHRQIMRWALAWYWKPTVYLLGYRGDYRMKGLEKYKRARDAYRLEVKRQQVERLEELKDQLKRMSGFLSNDLMRAEKLWTKMFTKGAINE